jgi:hypothetical protein
MERTLDNMLKDLELAKKELVLLLEAITVAEHRVDDIRKEIDTYKLSNRMYHPMSELLNYKGKRLDYIELVEINKSGTLSTDCFYNDELLKIDNDGHLFYSSSDFGILEYNEEKDRYEKWYHYYCNEHNYVGFMKISFVNES